MEAKATLKFARLSPQKTRLVVDMIRGKGVQDALSILKFSQKKSSDIVSRLLSSAVANAEQGGVSDVDRLFVKAITVDQGPALRRFMPRAQGRATRIRKPTSHITVVLGEK
jgi:large subunit ribosomal protein L22